MGLKQSKISKTNQYDTHFPPGIPPGYPYPPSQAPFIPGYPVSGYPPHMFPQPQHGFIPPGFIPQGQVPAHMLNWAPQDRHRSRRRTKRERRSDDYSNEGRNGDPNNRMSSQRHRRASEPAPVIPMPQPVFNGNQEEQGSRRRAPTPFIAPFETQDSDSYDNERNPSPSNGRSGSRQSHSQQRRTSTRQQPPFQANLGNVVEPLDPDHPVYGPPDPIRMNAQIDNPLPPPPRDLYETSPYKSLLNLPQTTALLTATYGSQQYPNPAALIPPTKTENRKSMKGLLRRFSTKKEKKPEPTQVRFVPIYLPPANDPNRPAAGTGPSSGSQTHGEPLSRSQSQHSRRPSFQASPPHSGNLHVPGGSRHSTATSSPPEIPPVPPVPGSPPEIRFDQNSKYVVFMNHSPHRVLYRNQTYPTALHLHEALKFLDQRPDIANIIRNTPDILDVYPVAAKYQSLQRSDWNLIFLDMLEEVLYHKFKQHPDLRILLLGTGTAKLVYAEADDFFWGIGNDDSGQNQLGKALIRVRERLREETG